MGQCCYTVHGSVLIEFMGQCSYTVHRSVLLYRSVLYSSHVSGVNSSRVSVVASQYR